MKRIVLAAAAIGLTMTALAQTDTTTTTRTDTTSTSTADTIRIGGMVIVRNGEGAKNRKIELSNRRYTQRPKSNLSTNWWIMDFGFSNVDDHTSFSAPQTQAFVASNVKKEDLAMRTGKSVNVNIWFFMQRLNLVKHVVNLKYGLGLELNNYHFENENVRIAKSPTQIFLDNAVNEKKNKLAADYLTVPVMLNFNFTPGRKSGFGFSAGVSAGYLYSARQKIKTKDDKDKIHGNLGLEKWKTSAIAELSLGPVRLYGSHGLGSMWEKGLDQRPYNVGLRFSRW